MTGRDNQGQPTQNAPAQPQEPPRKGVDPVVTVSYFGPDGVALDRLPRRRAPRNGQSPGSAPLGRHCADLETSILVIGPNGEALDKRPS